MKSNDLKKFPGRGGSLRTSLAAVCLALVLATGAQAQDDKMVPMPIPPSRTRSSSAPAPCPARLAGILASPVQELVCAQRHRRHADTLPTRPKAKATGAAVIVAPGGGFRTLSMENEGWDVARRSPTRASRPSCSSTA
jgi:hypothetical protein